MKPLRLVTLVAAYCISLTVLPSCTKEIKHPTPTGTSTGYSGAATLEINLTNGPSREFSAINLDIKGIEYNTSDDPSAASGWEPLNIDQPRVIDVLSLKNGYGLRLSQAQVYPSDIKQFRILFGTNNTIIKDGVTKPLNLPADMQENGTVVPYALNPSNAGFQSIWFDLDASNSINYDLNTDSYTFYAQPKAFDYNETGAIEGYISDFNAEIYIQTDVNSRSAYVFTTGLAETVNNGYFKVVGLPEGIYQAEMVSKGLILIFHKTKITIYLCKESRV